MSFKQMRYKYDKGQLIQCTFDSDLEMGDWSIDQYQADAKRRELEAPKRVIKKTKTKIIPNATSEGLTL